MKTSLKSELDVPSKENSPAPESRSNSKDPSPIKYKSIDCKEYQGVIDK